MYKKSVQEEIKSYLLIAFGMLIYAVAATGFMVPHKIVGGGATGISTIIYYLSNETIPVGISYFLINVVLVVIGLKVLGPKFGIKTVYAIIVGSAFLSVLQPFITEPLVSDKFMATVVASMLYGLGIAIALAQGGSSGGTDIIAMVIAKYHNVSPGKMLMYCDSGIIACSLFINSNIEALMYGFVVMGIVSFTVDFVLTGKKQSAQLFIFTDKYEEVANYIATESNHGVSVVDCTGWYSRQTKKMLIVVVRKNEAIDVLRVAKRIDPNVFMTMNTVMGVFGKGFEEVKGVK